MLPAPDIRQLQDLLTSGQLLYLPDGRFKLGEQAIRDCERDLTEAVDLEVTVKRHFQTLLAEGCPAVPRSSDGTVLGTFAAGSQSYSVAFDGANIWMENVFGNTVSKM